MDGFNHELRLLLTILLNAGLFGGAFWFAWRRGNRGMLQAGVDAMLIGFVGQYVAVALPGLFGVLNLTTASAVALAASAGMIWLGCRTPSSNPDLLSKPKWACDASSLTLIGSAIFTAAYLLVYAYDQRWLPPMATDALVYHLPTAVEWIQTGRLGMHPAWYWNPAAAWSPATSSTYMAWLILPTGNDVFVRFVQIPPLFMIFLIVARLARLLGCSHGVAGLLAASAAMAKPFFAGATFPKDDLFVTAFFGAAVLSLAPDNLRGRLSALRVGLAFGIVLASKYTVLLACPLFLFMIDAPFRSRRNGTGEGRVRDGPADTSQPKVASSSRSRAWRWWAIVLGFGLPLCVPWYVRNLVRSGNPLYPVDVRPLGVHLFSGMFTTERDQDLGTLAGVWRMLAETQQSLPVAVMVALTLGWLAAVVSGLPDRPLRVLRDPLRRAVTIGTPVTLVLFMLASPHHEVRYLFPLFLMLFAATAMAIARWAQPTVAGGETKVARGSFIRSLLPIGVATALLMLTLATQPEPSVRGHAAALGAIAAVIAVGLTCFIYLNVRYPRFRVGPIGASAAGIGLLLVGYVYWNSYVRDYYAKGTDIKDDGISFGWDTFYRAQTPLWAYVRLKVPDDAVIAVASSTYLYPYYDSAYQRRVAYAPVRADLTDYARFPRLGQTIPGDLIAKRVTDIMNANPDPAAWRDHLRRMKAQYLVIGQTEMEPNPPEIRLADQDPKLFEKLFEDAGGRVYRIRWDERGS